MVLIERKGREASDLLTTKFRRGRSDELTLIVTALRRKHRAMKRRALWRQLAVHTKGQIVSDTPSGDEQLKFQSAAGQIVLTYKAFDHRLDRIAAKERPLTAPLRVTPPA